MRLSGKTALITGASRGLGRAIALGFAAEGARVILVARDEQALATVAREVQAAGGEARLYTADLKKPNNVDLLAKQVLGEAGCPDILVNNAGVGGPQGLLTEISFTQWRETLQTNLDSMFLVTKAFLPAMMERKAGNIINVSSGAGKRVPFTPHRTTRSLPYAVSKFGVEGFTQALAGQLYPYGICVNAFSPGPLDTRLHDNSPPERRRGLRDPMECIGAVVYLAGQTCWTMTGETLALEEFLKNNLPEKISHEP